MINFKRMLRNILLFPMLVAFAKGSYEDDPAPVQLTTPESEAAVGQLQNLANTTPNLPSINLPGTSPEENQLLQQGMSLIQQLISGKMPEAYTLGMNKIKSILGGEYNPLTSPYYKGLKEEASKMKIEGASDIRNRSQLGGMLYSEPAMGIESEAKGDIDTSLLKTLGSLFESNINREASMIPQLLGYSNAKTGMMGTALSGINAMSGLAGKSGDINRQETMLNWQQDTNQAMFPWTNQAPLLQGLADYGNFYQPTQTYTPGLLDYALPVAGMFVK